MHKTGDLKYACIDAPLLFLLPITDCMNMYTGGDFIIRLYLIPPLTSASSCTKYSGVLSTIMFQRIVLPVPKIKLATAWKPKSLSYY